MTKGYTPLLASFVIYIGYLNIYNLQKKKPYTIRKSLQNKAAIPESIVAFA